MKRLVAAAFVVLAAVLAPSAAGQVPTQDSVTGILVDPTPTAFAAEVDAHSGPSGGNATGTARFQLGDVLGLGWQLDVTCLSVTDRTAVVGFSGTLLTHFGFDERYPTAGLIRIVDGGGPDSGLDRLEFSSVEGATDDPPIPGPTNCSAYPGGFPPYPQRGPAFNLQGDLVVTDSEPPDTYAQCRQAGWVKYRYTSHAQCNDGVHEYARKKCIFERAGIGIVAFRAKYGLDSNGDYAMRHCVRRYTGF